MRVIISFSALMALSAVSALFSPVLQNITTSPGLSCPPPPTVTVDAVNATVSQPTTTSTTTVTVTTAATITTTEQQTVTVYPAPSTVTVTAFSTITITLSNIQPSVITDPLLSLSTPQSTVDVWTTETTSTTSTSTATISSDPIATPDQLVPSVLTLVSTTFETVLVTVTLNAPSTTALPISTLQSISTATIPSTSILTTVSALVSTQVITTTISAIPTSASSILSWTRSSFYNVSAGAGISGAPTGLTASNGAYGQLTSGPSGIIGTYSTSAPMGIISPVFPSLSRYGTGQPSVSIGMSGLYSPSVPVGNGAVSRIISGSEGSVITKVSSQALSLNISGTSSKGLGIGVSASVVSVVTTQAISKTSNAGINLTAGMSMQASITSTLSQVVASAPTPPAPISSPDSQGNYSPSTPVLAPSALATTACGLIGGLTLGFNDLPILGGLLSSPLLSPLSAATSMLSKGLTSDGLFNVSVSAVVAASPNLPFAWPSDGSQSGRLVAFNGAVGGGLDVGDQRNNESFWFLPQQVLLGCVATGTGSCSVRVELQTTTGVSQIKVVTIPECLTNTRGACPLNSVDLSVDQNNQPYPPVSGLRFSASVNDGGVSATLYLGNLGLKWYDNSCQAGKARSWFQLHALIA